MFEFIITIHTQTLRESIYKEDTHTHKCHTYTEKNYILVYFNTVFFLCIQLLQSL